MTRRPFHRGSSASGESVQSLHAVVDCVIQEVGGGGVRRIFSVDKVNNLDDKGNTMPKLSTIPSVSNLMSATVSFKEAEVRQEGETFTIPPMQESAINNSERITGEEKEKDVSSSLPLDETMHNRGMINIIAPTPIMLRPKLRIDTGRSLFLHLC
jgi:hypothetical protein